MARADDVAVFGISYDPVEVLAAFAAQHGITFPLLSDEGSATIRRLGLLNPQVAAQHAHYGVGVDERHRGLPHPGTFLLDEDGIVVARRFEQSYRFRPSGTLLLEDLLGREVAPPAVTMRGEGPGVQAVAWIDRATYRPQMMLRVHVALEVEPDLHVYVPPTPPGYTPLEVGVIPIEGLTSRPGPLPAGVPFEVAGIDESFRAVTGRVRTHLDVRLERNLGPIDLDLQLRYQACSDRVCHPPVTLGLPLPVTGGDVLRKP